MDKISIIVPVYNVEKYLEECIDSLLNQTYKNIEIILVDDGSPDKCPMICDRYTNIDDRVVVLHKKNGGVSEARNKGIEISSGKFLTFVDADDYVDEKYIEKLYNNLNGCSMSECGFIYFSDGVYRKSKFADSIIMDWKDYLMERNIGDFLSYAIVWGKLYDKKLFKGIRFPVGRCNCEDESTSYKLVYKSKKISRIYDQLYYYRQREDGASQNDLSYKRINDLKKMFDEKVDFFQNIGENDVAYFFMAKKGISFINVYKSINDENSRYAIMGEIKNIFTKIILKRCVPFKYKIYMLYFILLRR